MNDGVTFTIEEYERPNLLFGHHKVYVVKRWAPYRDSGYQVGYTANSFFHKSDAIGFVKTLTSKEPPVKSVVVARFDSNGNEIE